MRKIYLIFLFLLLTNCTPKCGTNYTFNLYFVIPGTNNSIAENDYYFVANCKRKNWDIGLIRNFMLNNSTLGSDKSPIKNVAFYNFNVSNISRNVADLDEVEIEKELIVRFYFANNHWEVLKTGKINE